MRTNQFSEKFKIIQRALHSHGMTVRDKALANAIFSEAKGEQSAQVMWAECKSGKRTFASHRRHNLFRVLNDSTQGLFHKINPDAILGSVDSFGQVLVAAGIIDHSELTNISRKPLSELITDTRDITQLSCLLRECRQTYHCINEFETAIIRLPEGGKEVFAGLLRDFIDANWHSRDIRSVSIASAIIHRMSWTRRDFLLDAKLERRIEKDLNCIPAERLAIVKPLCYVGADFASGAFVRNIERLINDEKWRAYDCSTALKFYGGLKAAAWEVFKHGQERPLDRRCADVGRVITMYPYLVSDARMADLAADLEEKMMQSISAIGVNKECRWKVRHLMRSGLTQNR